MSERSVAQAAARGRDELRRAMRRGNLLDRQAASRAAVECALQAWAGLAGGPTPDHPLGVTWEAAGENAQGVPVRITIGVTVEVPRGT